MIDDKPETRRGFHPVYLLLLVPTLTMLLMQGRPAVAARPG